MTAKLARAATIMPVMGPILVFRLEGVLGTLVEGMVMIFGSACTSQVHCEMEKFCLS